MICIKCLKKTKGTKPTNLPSMLSHLNKYSICIDCDNTKDYSTTYYRQHKKHYRELHKAYKIELVDSYVANAIVDRTNLKAKDIPKNLIKAKRQFMKVNRIMKEE